MSSIASPVPNPSEGMTTTLTPLIWLKTLSIASQLAKHSLSVKKLLLPLTEVSWLEYLLH